MSELYKRIQQAIENEETYPQDAIGQEDYMLMRLGELATINPPLISGEEATAIFAGFILQRRPDTAIFQVQPRERGYGRTGA